MQVPIGDTGWYLCGWDDKPGRNSVDFSGREALAVQWLNQFHDDVFALRAMRGLLGSTHPWSSDEQVLADVAWRLSSGLWKARRAGLETFPAGGPMAAGEAAPFPKDERRPTASSSSSQGASGDAPVFPGDIDPAAIAQGQKEAAALGIPFCEECLRAQLAGR